MPPEFLRLLPHPAHTVCGADEVNRRKLLDRLLQGSLHNTSFVHLTNLMVGLGFRLSRIRGSHHMFTHRSIPDPVNLQPVHGQAKAYQVRQILVLIRRYNLGLEDES